MRVSNGFDRLSTEEELNQVLAVLNGFSRNGWIVREEDAADSEETTLCAETGLEDSDSDEAESLAQLVASKPELKN